MLTFLDEVKPTELFSNVYSHEASESAKSVADDLNVTFKPYANEPSSLFTHKCLMLDHEKAEVYFNDSEETEADTEEKSQILNNCKLENFWLIVSIYYNASWLQKYLWMRIKQLWMKSHC